MADEKDERRLERLAALIEESVLASSDEEILAEIKEAGEDPAVLAAGYRARFREAFQLRGKAMLKAARDALDAESSKSSSVIPMPSSASDRAKLARLLQRSDVPTTLAARQGQGMSDADVASLLEDLAELGINDSSDD